MSETEIKTAVIIFAVVLVLIIYAARRNKLPYEKCEHILTKNEYMCYKNLKKIADKYGYELFAKVRLADIVKVKNGAAERQKWFNKIKSKHVDFVLLDNNTLDIVLVIELDDSTHERADRRKRDRFVDDVFERARIPILHIHSYSYRQLENDILSAL